MSKKLFGVIAIVAVLMVALSACAPAPAPTPEVIEVQVTTVVEKPVEVVVEGIWRFRHPY
jgi:multidrug efflux pump subunit AcrA (membrane-fusion protein)